MREDMTKYNLFVTRPGEKKADAHLKVTSFTITDSGALILQYEDKQFYAFAPGKWETFVTEGIS